MIKEFLLGGGIMWMLLACIVLGLAILLERMYSLFFKIRLNPAVFLSRVQALVSEKGVQAGIALCDQTPSPVAKIVKAGLEKADKGKDVIEDAITRAGAIELGFLDRGMALLAGLTTVAPFLGFLGTVTGMMKSFAAIAAAGEVEPTIVASGISEALITTKWGLLIATPLAIIHILFTGKVDGYTRDMEEAAAQLVDYLMERGPGTKQ
ncbi:MAG TPA: MotA/TolQ/ExbB proton channel family protein [bacterium]